MSLASDSFTWDTQLISRYDLSGPRYTSYPTAVQFHQGFTQTHYTQAAQRSNSGQHPLSVYIHLPFCNTVCYYCACNKIVTKDRSRSRPYIDHLIKEITLQSELFDRGRPVVQLHCGGGTPTFIHPMEMTELLNHINKYFDLWIDHDDRDYSIEIDPREVDENYLAQLRDLGFNRISLGIQDFDPLVQKAVNRIQDEKQIKTLVHRIRHYNFRSLNMDLIYGLPHQNLSRFKCTLDKIIELAPDRISLFNYAHLPERFKPQRRIDERFLPSSQEKLNILEHAIKQLSQAGYRYIGMDHFAKSTDELSLAQDQGQLQRNFQGYSIYEGSDLIGLGVSAISAIDNVYSQNTKDLETYYMQLSGGALPIDRGIQLDRDDEIRRDAIMRLICHFRLDYIAIEEHFGIQFGRYFQQELKALQPLKQDGLVDMDETGITVSHIGRLLIRRICMIFDGYLSSAIPGEVQYSRII